MYLKRIFFSVLFLTGIFTAAVVFATVSVFTAVPMFAATSVFAAVIHVPTQQPTIQAGINAAVNGDTVLVSSGTYVENIDFSGKMIIVQSEFGPQQTIIDGNQANSVVTMIYDEPAGTVLDGFTLQNGLGYSNEYYNYGGGIYLVGSSPTIKNCVFTDNDASIGAGIYAGPFSAPTIDNSLFINNDAAMMGGGIYAHPHASATIMNSTFIENYAYGAGGGAIYLKTSNATVINSIMTGNIAPSGSGGGLRIDYSSPIIKNSTISDNTAALGGGVYSWGEDVAFQMTNSIIWNNKGTSNYDQMWTQGIPVVTYSDIQGGWEGEGNLDADPLFVGEGDYHLTADSPCIDAGIDAEVYVDIDDDVRPLGQGFDMGADEYVPPPPPEFTLDFTGDYVGGQVTLDFTLGATEPAIFVGYLVVFYPTVQSVPLWTVPLPAIDPPIDIPISFDLPSMGWVGIWGALATEEGVQISDFVIIDTGSGL